MFWPAMEKVLAISDEQKLLEFVELGRCVIHISDDMTSTNVPKEIDKSQTFFLTTNERLILSGLITRVIEFS